MINSVAEKVMIKKDCSEISIRMYSFFRINGSWFRWLWLAIIISGKSHAVKISKGEDRGSVKKANEKIKSIFVERLSVRRTIKLIIRLWIEGLIQIIEGFENHIRGASRIIGIIIFNIEEHLGFGCSLGHMC